MLSAGRPAAESREYDAMALDGEHGTITACVHWDEGA